MNIILNKRNDINGLRAIAVLTIILFHAFPNQIKGGFIGVDIFFVISGFLISSIIFKGLVNDKFSFLDFYKRRVRRIFPALLLVLFVCYCFGWFNLLADEYKQLGKHIMGGSSFISNFILWNESGYFDNAAETKPLLHLWSLGIEEQFYLICPVLFWLSWKFRVHFLVPSIVIALISFGLNCRLSVVNTVGDFYSPLARFWELMIGACLASINLFQVPNFLSIPGYIDKFKFKLLPHIQSLFGLLLLILGLLFIDKNASFPGYLALIPTLGTALIISSGEQAWVNKLFLSNRVLNWIGLVSYPLYLWHWPLLSLVRINSGGDLSVFMVFAMIALSFLLATLTYYLVEIPLRYGAYENRKSMALVCSSLVILFLGFGVYEYDGYSFREYPTRFAKYLNTASIIRKKECFEVEFGYKKENQWYCVLGAKSMKSHAFAFRDSHALNLFPALEKYATDEKKKIFFTGESGCPPILGIQSMRGNENIYKYNCQKLNEKIFQFVKDHHIKNIFLIARWSYYYGGTTKPNEINYIAADVTKPITKEYPRQSLLLGLKETIERYKNIGTRVYVFEDTPQQFSAPSDALKKSRLTDKTINNLSVSTDEHIANQEWFAQVLKQINSDNLSILNFNKALCSELKCLLAKNNQLLYSDDDHLSNAGAELIYPEFKKQMNNTIHLAKLGD